MRKLGTTIFSVLIGFVALAQSDSSGTSFSLAEAQAYAIKNAYRVRIAALDVDASEKKKNEVRAMGLPQINAEAKYQNFLQVPTTLMEQGAFDLGPSFEQWITDVSIKTQTGFKETPPNDKKYDELQFGTKYNNSVGASASQLLFDGSYLVGLKVAKQYIGLYEQMEEQTHVDVKDQVAQAYYTVLVAFENKDVLTASLKNLQKSLDETIKLQEAGFAAEQDVDQLQLTLSQLSNSVNAADRQLIMSEQLLKWQMGLDIESPITLTDNLDQIVQALNYDDLTAQNFNLENHIDYRLLQTNQSLMNMNWKLEKAANLPSLSAYINHSQNNMGNDLDLTLWYPSTVWGVNLNVPIFASGTRYYKSQLAKIEYEKVGIQLEQVEQSLKMQSNVAKLELQTAYDNYQTQKKNLALAEKIQNNTTTRYQEGMVSSMELTQVQNQYLQTQGEYINSLFQLLNAKSKLDKANNNY